MNLYRHYDYMCPLSARAIACAACRNGDARYTDAESYLALTKAPNLFVYGTLKRGQKNNDLLVMGGAEFVCEDAVDGYATAVMFPLAVRRDGARLHGEVWAGVGGELWDALDSLERSYARERVATAGGLDATMYVSLFAKVGPTADRWPPRWRG